MSDDAFDADAWLADLRTRARTFAEAAAPALEGLEGVEAARKALGLLAGGDWLKFVVAAAHGGATPTELVEKDELSVQAMAVLRDEFAHAHGLLDLMFVMQGLGSYPLLRGGELDVDQKFAHLSISRDFQHAPRKIQSNHIPLRDSLP